MQKKDSGKITKFFNFLFQLNRQDWPMDIAGRTKNNFATYRGGTGNFKQTQRKERSLSRRRNMKPSAR